MVTVFTNSCLVTSCGGIKVVNVRFRPTSFANMANLCGKQPIVKINCGEISYSGNGQYLIKVDGICSDGIKMMILNSENLNDTLATYHFRCKRVPDPVVKIAGQHDGASISKSEVLVHLGIYAEIENFDYDFRIKILSFQMSNGLHNKSILSEGGKFSSKQYELIKGAKPGEKILDLCAAPGGKAVQIGAAMRGQGLLVANDNNSDRVKGLVKNIELYGIRNAIVTNETPDKLSKNFRNFFDKILIDAPCSGEGMLRKDFDAAKSMKNFTAEKCASMQWEILKEIDSMLKAGGQVVYSTCTFSPEENEKMISRFLKENTNFELVEIPKQAGIESGRPAWSDGNPEISKTARLWPHKLEGEGHFVALLHKREEINNKKEIINKDIKDLINKDTMEVIREGAKYVINKDIKEVIGKDTKIELNKINKEFINSNPSGTEEMDEKYRNALHKFEAENLNIDIEGYFYLKGSNIYHLPVPFPLLTGIKVAKFGWYLGEFMHDKFEPSHSLVISLVSRELKNIINLPVDSNEINSFLKGETLMLEGKKGFLGICVDGNTLGWAKQTGDFVKNMYPKGWRKLN